MRVCGVDDLAIGKMKEFKVPLGPKGVEGSVLIVRTSKKTFKATGAKCT